MPTVQVQVVVYNSGPRLSQCLRSISAQTYPIGRVLVIDNNSRDGCVEEAKRAGHSFDLIQLEENVGYAGGHNIGFRQALQNDIDYVLTVNPDVVLSPNYVATLVTLCERNKSHGGATGKLLRPTVHDNSHHIIDSAGLQMGPFYHVRDRGSKKPDEGQYGCIDVVWGICGAAALYRCALLQDIEIKSKTFDETFFVYKEDVDLCWRANRRGWTFIFSPIATAMHERGWKKNSQIPTHAAVHSFVNQIALLINHVPMLSFYTWLSLGVELSRYILLLIRRPVVALRVLRLLQANWLWMWQKRSILRQRGIRPERVVG